MSAYRGLTSTDFDLLDVARRQRANGDGQAKLGPAAGEVRQADDKVHAENPATNKPSPYRKLAPLFLKSLIPDGVQQLIPDSAFQQLEEGPSEATLHRREEARRKREERRKRRLAPMP